MSENIGDISASRANVFRSRGEAELESTDKAYRHIVAMQELIHCDRLINSGPEVVPVTPVIIDSLAKALLLTRRSVDERKLSDSLRSFRERFEYKDYAGGNLDDDAYALSIMLAALDDINDEKTAREKAIEVLECNPIPSLARGAIAIDALRWNEESERKCHRCGKPVQGLTCESCSVFAFRTLRIRKLGNRDANQDFNSLPKFDASSRDWMLASDLASLLGLSATTLAGYRKEAKKLRPDRHDKYGDWNVDKVGPFRRAVVNGYVAYYLPRLSELYRMKINPSS